MGRILLEYDHQTKTKYFTSTMHFALIPILAALGASAFPVVTTPLVHVVDVGKDGLTYTPSSITANPGDFVEMRFYAQNHTLVQSAFKTPCTPLADGIFAGFHPSTITKNSKGLVVFETVTFPVVTSSPLWFYCAQDHHCQAGMTFAINPPPGSVAAFNALAATEPNNIAPRGGPFGVILGHEEVFLE